MDASSWEAGALVAGAAVILVGALAMGQRDPRPRSISFADVIAWHRVYTTIHDWVASDSSTVELASALDKLESEIGDDRAALLSQAMSILDTTGLDVDLRSTLRPLLGINPFAPTTHQQPPTTTEPVVPGDNGEVVRLEAELAAKVTEVEAVRRLLAESDAAVAAHEEGLRVTRDALTLADAELATVKAQLADADQSRRDRQPAVHDLPAPGPDRRSAR